MPVDNRHHYSLRVALILLLSVLVLNACRQDPVIEPAVEPPVAAPEEVAPPVVAQEPVVEQEPVATQTPMPLAEPVVVPAVDVEPPDPEEPIEMLEPVDSEEGQEVVAEEAAGDTEDAAIPEMTPTPAPVARLHMPGAIATRTREQTISTSALVIRPNENVAPPLSIEVSANRELEGHRFKVSGILRNDSAEPYTSLGVIATFYRTDGSRYGPVRARIQCPILGPGDACPFIVEATDKDLSDVMLHPEGRPTDRRQPIPVELRTTRRYVDNLGYVHIVGTVSNPNPVAAQDITINGVLLESGQIVSMGADLILGPLAPGASAPFDVMVRYVPYSETRLYVQALPPR